MPLKIPGAGGWPQIKKSCRYLCRTLIRGGGAGFRKIPPAKHRPDGRSSPINDFRLEKFCDDLALLRWMAPLFGDTRTQKRKCPRLPPGAWTRVINRLC